MTTRSEIRRALVHAQLELENRDEAALDEAFKHAQRAAFLILDLRGSTAPIHLDRPSAPPTTLPPATAGLHADGRSAAPTDCFGGLCRVIDGRFIRCDWHQGPPVAAPPSDTASEGCPSPHESAGNPARGGGN